MQVTALNFGEMHTALSTSIKDSLFVSFDFEFTGLANKKEHEPLILDTSQDRYTRLRQSVETFKPMQIGISTFKNGQDGSIRVNAYNVFLFNSSDFSVQATSLTFLANNGFDFTTWAKHGVGWMSFDDEVIKAKKGAESKDVIVDGVFVEFVSSSIDAVRQHLGTPDLNTTDLKIPTASAFHKRVLFQELRKEFGESIHASGGDKCVVITGKTALGEQVDGSANLILSKPGVSGFRSILDLISSLKIPIVGHNMMLDCMYLTHHFYHPLPALIGEFKAQMNELFTEVYDTKYIADLIFPGTSTVLCDVYEKFLAGNPAIPLGISLDVGFEAYSHGGKGYHEAGFDSYITGVSFINLSRINTLKKSGVATEDLLGISKTTFEIPLEFCGKVFCMRSLMRYFNFTGDCDTPDTTPLYHVSELAQEWSTRDVVKSVESKFGSVFVNWIDSTSCWIRSRSVKSKESARDFVNSGGEFVGCKVVSYSTFMGDNTSSDASKRKRDCESGKENGDDRKHFKIGR